MAREPITLWVEPNTRKTLCHLAASQKVSVSKVAASYLEHAVSNHAESVGAELVVPAVEAAVRREVAARSDRLARLQARTALESATARRLVFNLLLVSGYGAGEARSLNDAAWQKAVESLKRPLEAIQELLGAGEATRDPSN